LIYFGIIKYSYVCRDNLPTVLLTKWPLHGNMWDGEILYGPVPTLWAEDIKASEDALKGKINEKINYRHINEELIRKEKI